MRQLACMYATPEINKCPDKINWFRKRIVFLFGFFLIAIIPSCLNHKDTKVFTVGFSQCTMVNKFRQTMLKEMVRELSFHPEINFIFKDANGVTEKQVEQVQELIDQKVDLLIVSPNEAAPITPIVEKAFTNGIKVIIVDRKTISQNYSAYVGASNYEVGVNAATFANAFLKGNGNVLEVSDIPGSSADIDRHRGFTDFLKEHTAIKYIAKVYEEGDENPSGEKLTVFLKSDSNIQLIFAQNDRLAFSAFKVCKKMGLEKRIKIIGVDGLPGENGGVDLVEKKVLEATVIYPTGGEEAIRIAVNIVKNLQYKKENRLMTTIIDSSNVRIMKLQNEKVMAQQEDIDKRQKNRRANCYYQKSDKYYSCRFSNPCDGINFGRGSVLLFTGK
ncbi:substrate-binding domain-containing protein [Ferruginibacter sp.]|uniref:substrate-binding domain-containing protein n=1 Tax=Ferruginibacter sp. TaxID=1940288 RepID=UPI00265B3CD0|nr:substrate-binding domain-containing protein [Ferruginibacter sp.]